MLEKAAMPILTLEGARTLKKKTHTQFLHQPLQAIKAPKAFPRLLKLLTHQKDG